jgi:CDP-paratose 2-epimerase
MKILVTGNAGLIGSEAAEYFYNRGHDVYGIDNNMRATFFGKDGDTTNNLVKLMDACPGMKHKYVDIRDRVEVLKVMEELKPDVVIHCAAQPSHDLAAKMPFEDFDTNALGTFNLLEATRQFARDAVFIQVSTNKVYGDAPNRITLVEKEKRYDYDTYDAYRRFPGQYGITWTAEGITERFPIDNSLHSLFGASKLSGDISAQEYGKYFNMKVGVFRGGCLTGARHSGAQLHGYLSYFFKAAAEGRQYTIFGYKGKQVRDQIHSHDVIRAFEEFIGDPQCGEVYNIRGNSISILESIDRVEQIFGKKFDYVYDETNRIGDHICYYSDLTKLKSHFPKWDITMKLDDIFEEFARATAGKRAA